jgi:hypothetical protein
MKMLQSAMTVALVSLLLGFSSGSAQTPRTVSARLGAMGGGGLCGVVLVPGAELRSGGPTHLLLGADANLVRGGHRPCGPAPLPGETAEVVRTSLSPPRIRVGFGWRSAAGIEPLELRLFVGQQGIVEGFQPLAGAGVVFAPGGWGVGIDGSAARGKAYERTQNPWIDHLYDERPLRTTWTPRWEVYGRGDVGALDRETLRPAVAGLAAGAAGGVLGGTLGVMIADCSGTGCAGPFILGAALGEAVALPLGVHLAGRRGSYPAGVLTSVGVAAAGIFTMAFAEADVAAQGIVVIVPIAQLIATIAVDRRTGTRN